MNKQVILTGLRTNAEYHLGNYLGALLPMVQMAQQRADEYQVNLFAPDLHSFTTPIDHSKFHAQTIHNLKLFAACGFPLDHDNVYMYRQSRIPAHSELAWILSNFAYFGEMLRMREFRDKAGIEMSTSEGGTILKRGDGDHKNKPVNMGLMSYPILMAADILLYGASFVPVGEDQRQHLEFTRDIAERMNNQFGKLFVLPKSLKEQQELVERESAPRIRSLRDPSKKMSKSIDDPAGTIRLTDTPEEATKKIMSATTDNESKVRFHWENQPGVTNLLQILALLTGREQEDVNNEWEGSDSYGALKTAVAKAVSETLQTIQDAMNSVDEKELMLMVEKSEEKMIVTANKTLLEVQKAVGLRA